MAAQEKGRKATTIYDEEVPAVFADRCNVKNAANNGGMPETNHRIGEYPLGGNVVHLDGSAKWFPMAGNVWAKQSYVMNGGSIGGHVAVPSSGIWPRTNGDWVLDVSRNDNLLMGRMARNFDAYMR